MVKIFFATFFIAELIIALAVISKIYQLDRSVNKWNTLVLSNQNMIRVGLSDLRSFLEDFATDMLSLKQLIAQKRQEYAFKFLKTSVTYFVIFMLRGKYKKAILSFQLVKEIYEGLVEAEA